MNSLPPPDRLKFTTIAHATHRYLSPLSPEKARRLIDLMHLAPGAHVLDIGCGRAEFLLELADRRAAHGLGVDLNPAVIDAARAAAMARDLADRVKFECGPLVRAVPVDARFDGIVCMGASQAIGTLGEAMRWAFEHLHPGGVAIVADGFWRRKPDPAYLAALGGAAEDEITTHAGNALLARAAGFRVLATAAASDDEWDEYEGRYCAAVERYIDEHPDDPDAGAMGQRIRAWHEAYLRWGRDTLGFGFYALLKPSSA